MTAVPKLVPDSLKRDRLLILCQVAEYAGCQACHGIVTWELIVFMHAATVLRQAGCQAGKRQQEIADLYGHAAIFRWFRYLLCTLCR